MRYTITKDEIPLNIIIGLAIIRTPLLNMCELMDNKPIQRYIFILFFGGYIIWLFLSIIKFFYIRHNINKILYSTLIVSIIIIWSMFIDVAEYVQESILSFLLFMIFPFICTVIVNNRIQMYVYLKYAIFINYIIGLITGYLFILSGRYYGADAMMATYAMALPTSYYCYMQFREKNHKIIYALLTLLGIIMMFFTGSRGGFIVILSAFILGLMSTRKFNELKFFFQLIPLIILFLIFFYNQLTELFQGTRIFDLLESGHISGSSGREWYYNAVWNAIAQKPLWGWGLYGDRICTNGIWAHNLFLEIWCDYGIIIGSLFMIWFFCESVKFIIVKMSRTITILFLLAIPQLLVSSSYLLSCYFWIYIGALISFSQTTHEKMQQLYINSPNINRAINKSRGEGVQLFCSQDK